MIPYFIILVFYVVFTITNSDSHRELALELGLGLELNWTRLAST